MANNIEAVTLFQQACDRQMIEGATSGWMEANAGQVKYSGGREIKIPTLSTDGLGDYDKNSGYPRGKVSLTYLSKLKKFSAQVLSRQFPLRDILCLMPLS